jgi:hypothetical protein
VRRTTALALSASLLSAAPAAASAGVDVSPDSSDHAIQVRADRSDPGHVLPLSSGDSRWLVFRGVAVSLSGELWIHGIKLLPEPTDHAAAIRARIQEALTRVPLPAFAAHVQPTTRTLVNADTILYTEPAPTDRTINTLGYTVHIHATPATYTWQFGDGTTTTTTTPGAPYPNQTLTHQYRHTGTVTLNVTAHYLVRYRTDNEPWQDLGVPIDSPGPNTTLQITEAQAILIAP